MACELARLDRQRLTSRLARGAISAFVVMGTAAAVAFLSQLVLARVLGVRAYGAYSFVFAWINILAVLSTLGFPSALLRFVATYQAAHKRELLYGIICHAKRQVMLAGTLVAVTGVAITAIAVGHVRAEITTTFFVGFAIVPLYARLQVAGSLLRAFGQIISSMAPDLLAREATVLALVGAAFLVCGHPVTAPMAMLFMLMGTSLALGASSCLLGRTRVIHELSPSPATRRDTARWSRTALVLLGVTATNLALRRLDVVIVGTLADPISTGVYAIAARLADAMSLPAYAVNALLAPTIASLHSTRALSLLQRAVNFSTLWISAGACLIMLVLASSGAVILSFLGDDFQHALPVLRILVASEFCISIFGPVMFLLTMTGNHKPALLIQLVALLVYPLAIGIGVSRFGILGAAIGRAIVLTMLALALACCVARKVGIRPAIAGPFLRGLALRSAVDAHDS